MKHLQDIWGVFTTLLNWLGEILIDNKFIGFIQEVFEGHLEVINFFLRRYDSKSFWFRNITFSIPLTIGLAIKAYFKTNILSYEILLGFVILSGFLLKIYDKQGNIEAHNNWEEDYMDYEQENWEETNNQEEYEEEFKVDYSEETIEEPYEEPEVEPEEIVRISNKALSEEEEKGMESLKNLFSNALKRTDEQLVNPNMDLVDAAMEKDPALNNALNIGKITKAVNNRMNIGNDLDPLQDMEAQLRGL